MPHMNEPAPADPPTPPAGSARVDRRTLMLDAAIQVIATQGLRGLTHRAVQEEAGLPNGSVTYYFKTRDQLILAVIDRMATRDKRFAGEVTGKLMRMTAVRPVEIDYAQIAGLMRVWWTEGRDVQLARLELELSGAREPLIREEMIRCQAEFRGFAELVVLALGSTNATLDGHILLAQLQGLLFDHVTRDWDDPQILEVGLRRVLESVRL
ncbi:TetR/AcrR family transcriptional regulator [Embleya sp. AB8]|uniref:TetR/AcrR family transcriptional regulator n=1 Tax=Embleya sp. AB8 TaxID=3156304 RepID=UPI003C795EEB